MTLLSRTKEIAKDRGISMESLAKQVGISKSGIYQWDKHEPKPSTVKKVATVLNVSTDYLLGRSENTNSFSSPDVDEASGLGQSIMMAFDGKDVPDEDKEKLLEFARFLKSQRGR
ncbi:MAG: helix-turn-helix domain-containing protein [Leuconostoc mesenteroides]